MKILYFLAHPESIGGASKVLMMQAYIMHKYDHTVKIIIPNDINGSHIVEYEILCNRYGLQYDASYYSIATCIEQIDILKDFECYKHIKELIYSWSPDIVHSVQINTAVEYIARELSIPHLMNIYQISKGMFNIRWMDVFPQFHSCDSLFFCKQWEKGLEVESRCIRVAYESNYLPKSNITDNGTYSFICIASFLEHKNQLTILRAFDNCIKQGFNFHITFVGDDRSKYGEMCHEFVKSNSLESRVTFTGMVVDVEKYLCQSDLLIHISSCESYPGVLVEAIANRVPVLTTAVGGIPELFIDEQNCFLIKGYDIDSLTNGLERYFKYVKENKLENIVDSAYQMYIENHTFESIYKDLSKYYLDMQKNYHSDCTVLKKNISMIKRYINDIGIDLYSEECKKSIWYLFHIKRIIDENRVNSATIWGAGVFGEVAMEWCRVLGIQVTNILDTYKTGYFHGIEIVYPEDITIRESEVIFLAMSNMRFCEDNMRIIEKTGKVRNQDYFLVCNNPCIQI